MEFTFEKKDQETIKNLKPTRGLVYSYIAKGELAVNMDKREMITMRPIKNEKTIFYGDSIALDLFDDYAELYLWQGYEFSVKLHGHYNGD